jgi:N-acetylglucosamine-6-phosphate deacetylase
MTRKALQGNVVLPDRIMRRGIVLIEEGRIAEVFSGKGDFADMGIELIDRGDAYISPGLIDLHLHGVMGKDVMDGKVESLVSIAGYQAKCGVTGFLGSTISAPLVSVFEAIKAIREAKKNSLPSEILGVYIEGPFLSGQKKGAHDGDEVRGMVEDDLRGLAKAVSGMNCIISLAPEVGQNQCFIAELRKSGMVVAIGHSDATYEEAMKSFEKGVSHATHLFNAMRGFHHRKPGVVGAVLDSHKVTAELIADGVHVHPAALRLAVARKGAESICLVTDSIAVAGKGDGVYSWGKKEIELKGSSVTIKGTDILAGSVLTLNRAIKNMIEWTGVTISQAVNMASLNPARVLGLGGRIGSVEIGKDANLVLFDQDFNVLDTVFKGKFIKKNSV